jgi:conjugal transfer mating pair stabilization protein TraG
MDGGINASFGIESSDRGSNSETAQSSMDIINYDVRAAIGEAERHAASSHNPAEAFARELRTQVIGNNGLRNRYLEEADHGRGTFDISSPITSVEKHSLLKKGRFTLDAPKGPGDGDSEFKERKDD